MKARRMVAGVTLLGAALTGCSQEESAVTCESTYGASEMIAHYDSRQQGWPKVQGMDQLQQGIDTLQQLGGVLAAHLYANGCVDFHGTVQQEVASQVITIDALRGMVSCKADQITLNMKSVGGLPILQDAHIAQADPVSFEICDGDRVSERALDPSKLPTYVLAYVMSSAQ